MKLSSRLLREARERTLARSREAFNEHQVHTQFEPGERVRLWKRVAIRRKVGSDEISSKLKIFNTVYVVVVVTVGLDLAGTINTVISD